MNETACTSYRPGQFCRDGFPPNAACAGHVCHSCGQPTKQIPACMREDLGSHLIDERGLPRFASYRAAQR